MEKIETLFALLLILDEEGLGFWVLETMERKERHRERKRDWYQMVPCGCDYFWVLFSYVIKGYSLGTKYKKEKEGDVGVIESCYILLWKRRLEMYTKKMI